MKELIRLFHLLLSHLLRPVLLWVRTSALQENLKEYLELSSGPVIYVLPKRSIIDYLVLLRTCRQYGLPEPDLGLDFNRSRRAVCLFLEKTNAIKRVRRLKPSQVMLHLVRQVQEQTGEKPQIVPVSPFWGKDPGTEEPSIIKLIFNDDEDAGWLQKFFIVLAQGRNNKLYFGKPFQIDEQLRDDESIKVAARKIRRVLRIHFRRARNTVLGQKLYVREQVISRVVAGKLVRLEIEKESKDRPQLIRSLEARARHYARELSADQTYSMVRVFELFLGKLWNKLFEGVDVVNVENVAKLAAQSYEIVYVPTHRSHLDYLLVNYTVYKSGLPTPHTAAGINLNFFPAGWFLRRAGAFFIRRSFHGNRLYSAVVEEYMHYLLTQGYPISFFPEGGRSRTGRLLPLKTGMLSMVIRSYLRNSARPVALVPVFLAYDKVIEVKSYLTELGGGAKKKESMLQLLGARKILQQYFGKAYLSYGDPILLDPLLDQQHPGWREAGRERPEWLASFVNDLAQTISRRNNEAAVITPIGLLGVGLLAAWQKALPKEELFIFMQRMISLHKLTPYHPNMRLVSDDVGAIFDLALKLKSISLFHHAAGDVVYVNDVDGALISYYRNNVIHIFALPSLIARFFQRDETIDEESLCRACAEIYDVLREELFLSWEEDVIEAVVKRYLKAMAAVGLLHQVAPQLYHRPPAQSDDFVALDILSQALGLTFDRLIITAVLLAKHSQHGLVDSDEFLQQCHRMAQRLAILSGLNNPEIVEKTFIQKHIQLLKRKGLLLAVDDKKLRIDERVAVLAKNSQRLLSPDALRSIERIFKTTHQQE
ncbi:MAG: glycerol-3-phosphate 1-O-acyltransferase PlsB, partial [Proteobacteria bacterium]|nr:glycerol-3-phosphate 1-O-acyltransferase PlsB [Pseudomonadota bacterium]